MRKRSRGREKANEEEKEGQVNTEKGGEGGAGRKQMRKRRRGRKEGDEEEKKGQGGSR